MLAWSMTLALALCVALEVNAAEGELEQGAEAFQRGAFEEAAARWAEAARSYGIQGQVASQISALTYLARAQSELGQALVELLAWFTASDSSTKRSS
jgi:hypothetical protein